MKGIMKYIHKTKHRIIEFAGKDIYYTGKYNYIHFLRRYRPEIRMGTISYTDRKKDKLFNLNSFSIRLLFGKKKRR